MQQRRLQFVEGTSSKFWQADQDGVTLTVTYGRIGTAGQTQEKTFGSDAEAEAAFAKQVAEKLKKGYTDDGSPAAAVSAPAPKKAEAPAPKPEPVPVAPAADVDPPVRLNLKPEDFPASAAKTRTAMPRPEPRPFDQDDCVRRLLAAASGNQVTLTYPSSWSWSKAKVDLGMSREEAHFWLSLLGGGMNQKVLKTTATLEAWARGLVCDGSLPMPTIGPNTGYGIPEEIVIPIYVLYGVTGVMEFFGQMSSAWWIHTYISASKRLVLRYLTDDEIDTLSASLLTLIQAAKEPPLWAMELSAGLARSADTLRTIVAGWPDGSGRPQYFGGYGSQANQWLKIALGIGDPDTVAAEVRRLDALPLTVDDIKALLAATGFANVDLIARSVLAHTSRADAEKLAAALALAEGPQTAPAMLDIALESKAPKAARDWLEKFPAFAIEGLAPLLGTTGKKADAALEMLRGFKKQGHTELLARKAETLPILREKVLDWEEIVHPELTEVESPDWVLQVFGGALSVPDAPADVNPPRRLDLPETAFAACKLPPLAPPHPKTEPAPFDLQTCLDRLRAIGSPTDDNWRWKWERAKVRLPLSREEAHFWNDALVHGNGNRILLPALETWLQGRKFTGVVPKKERCHAWRTDGYATIAYQVRWTLDGIPGLIEVLEGAQYWAVGSVQIVVEHILPWMDAAARADLLQRLVQKARDQKEPDPWGLLLGAHLGMTQEQLRTAAQKWPSVDGRYGRSHGVLPLLVLLDDPDLVAERALALRAFPDSPDEARALLAASGGKAVDAIALAVLEGWGDGRDALARTVLGVETPAVAAALLSWRRSAAFKRTMREWFDRNPALTVEGLAPMTVKKGPDADAAIDHLREMTRRGWRWLIQKKLPELSPEAAAAVQSRVLDYDPARTRKPNPADVKLAALLPPIVVRTQNGPRRLTDSQKAQVIALLRTTPITEPSPELALLRDGADRIALDTFLTKLFDGWLGDGGPSKERWKFEALGHLGGDAVALKLTPLVRAWPGESQHQRAVLGLDVLRAIGTDTALMQLHGMAQKLSFKTLKQRAGECLEAIAADRGLTPEELADRIIPDGGLDERGGCTLDFGPRQFEFVLGPDLKPLVRDADGQRRPDLPKPTQKDDADKAAAAQAQWKLLKKQVADVAKTQATRLEQAMVLGRRWSYGQLKTLFIEHPVMVHLVRRLVWAVYDDAGKPTATFRICDDSTLADSADTLFPEPDPDATVGVVHPSHLSDAERGAWGEVLADYELIAPFVQLSRTVHRLTDDEKTARRLSRFQGVKVDPKVLVFGLENLGWHHGSPQDGGSYACHHKDFGGLYAVVTYADGVWVGGNGDDWDDQVVEAAGFVRDRSRATDGWFGDNEFETNGIVLGEIDPVIISEVLYDLTRIVEKGRK